MSAYNFQKQFIQAIRSGKKRSTIRKRRKNGYLPRVGDVISLYTGMRTKQCELIKRVPVNNVRSININIDTGSSNDIKFVEVIVGPDRLSSAEVYRLAVSDGFKDVEEFCKFFRDKYGTSVSAHLIEWST